MVRIKKIVLDQSKPFGQQVREARKVVGMRGTDVSKLTGWSPSNLNHYETGKNKAGQSIHTALKYLKAIGVSEVIFKL
jgi:transcriptional regulator with XRE-family HTH domain